MAAMARWTGTNRLAAKTSFGTREKRPTSPGRTSRISDRPEAYQRELGAASGRPGFRSDFREAVERLRIVHQDPVALALVRRPLRQEIEQHRIVRLVVERQTGMRPIASPHHALGRGF